MNAKSLDSSAVASANRLIIKVGSSLVTNEGKGVDKEAFNDWAEQIFNLRLKNKQVVLVSSGAIAEGMARLGWSTRPSTMYELQAAAAVGQMGLCQAYEAAFSKYKLHTAQVLLTYEDLKNKNRYLNARDTLFSLLNLGVIPIVNENDTVVAAERRLGDNDTLGALVTNLIRADAFIILTDQRGLYDSDPRKNPSARFISHARTNDPELEIMATSSGSDIGTGGMLTKVLAAKRANFVGAVTIIASGHEHRVLTRLANGESIGTELRSERLIFPENRKWLSNQLDLRGRIRLNEKAVCDILKQGESLFSLGVTNVEGEFESGELVACIDPSGFECARGLINYSSSDTRRILYKPNTNLLGIEDTELMNRENLILTKR